MEQYVLQAKSILLTKTGDDIYHETSGFNIN